MEPVCYRCQETYSVRDGCDPSTFCDTCAHDIAEAALAFAIAYDADAATPGHEIELGNKQNDAMINVIRATRPRG